MKPTKEQVKEKVRQAITVMKELAEMSSKLSEEDNDAIGKELQPEFDELEKVGEKLGMGSF